MTVHDSVFRPDLPRFSAGEPVASLWREIVRASPAHGLLIWAIVPEQGMRNNADGFEGLRRSSWGGVRSLKVREARLEAVSSR